MRRLRGTKQSNLLLAIVGDCFAKSARSDNPTGFENTTWYDNVTLAPDDRGRSLGAFGRPSALRSAQGRLSADGVRFPPSQGGDRRRSAPRVRF